MSDGDRKQLEEALERELKSQALKISGWEYDDSDSVLDNMVYMYGSLAEAIKSRDDRIQNLQLKLGQAAERL